MKLTDKYKLVIPDAKLKEYLLSPHHSRGKHKARIFSKLGISEEKFKLLEQLILKIASEREIESEREDKYGKIIVVSGFVSVIEDEQWKMKTVWIVEDFSNEARLITAYPE